ncbi:sensor histidine kinase [Oscillatoria sp. FACHB-1407]|uniref:sensor histidine kinase n=1 Tax=Oscillatoria sp. FACHB-1407 TaxID=2692847 RepID=UPI001682A7C1|nr:sensor histidine kinase [Oscillatoria sp. FACHB-1407]MBD2461406.1 sensor histidine kinase [Oscillatoria sp. FACHB-1407]
MQGDLSNTAIAPVGAIRVKNHPFPFLLYLEWGLVALAILSELLPNPAFRMSRYPMLTILSIAMFGVMGLRLPMGRPLTKIGYVLAEFALIILATATGLRGLRLFPFLYLVLVIRSCLMFRLAGRLMITGMAFVVFLLILIYRVKYLIVRLPFALEERSRLLIWGFAINSVLLFGLALLFVLLLVNALIAERQSRQQLAIANEQLRDYAQKVENLAAVQERNRIAREIHDSLGHALTALNIQLEGALKLWQTNPSRAQTFLQEAKQLGSTALQEVRQSVATLRSDPLRGQSLVEAIAQLTNDFYKTTGVQPQCQIYLTQPLPNQINTTLYRIIQEALTNTCKHAAATEVRLHLHNTPTHVELTYHDNGNGFQVNQNQTGFGLQGMRERTLAIQGQFTLNSSPGQGVQLMIHIPL